MARIPGIHLLDQVKNYFINGNMDFAQRAASGSPANGGYQLDRWRWGFDGSIGAYTISQQAFTTGQTAVPNGPKFFQRINITSAGSGSTIRYLSQVVENVSTLAGKTVTVSFYAQADAARSVSLVAVQTFGTGGSPSANVTTAISSVNLTTSWQKYVVTFTLPSIAGTTLGTNGDDYVTIRFLLPINVTMTIDFAQMMLNEGSSAANFQLAAGGLTNLGGELALCQRYYEKNFDSNVAPANNILTKGLGIGVAQTSGEVDTDYLKFSIPKRTAPTITTYASRTGETSGMWTAQSGGSYILGATSTVAVTVTTDGFQAAIVKAAAYTLGVGYTIYGNWTADAEF